MSRFRHILVLAALGAVAARADSLYDPRTFRSLAADHKAFRVGDALTVQVYENSSAASSTDTATQRQNGLDASLRLLNGKQLGGAASVGGEFAGGGSTQRTNRLLATVTVTVREVLPNGDLRVEGEQLVTVNDEQQKVTLSGQVRPQDISADNVVQSTRLAEARITYAGDGDLTLRQHRSWWRKILDWVGL